MEIFAPMDNTGLQLITLFPFLTINRANYSLTRLNVEMLSMPSD